jgi:amphi-Trp domain-containing protein
VGKRKSKFAFSATLEATQVADYLMRIADGIRRGVVGLSAGGESVRLAPTAMLALGIKAEAKAEKASGRIALDLIWKPEFAADGQSLEITVDPREESGRHAPAGTRD